MADTSAAVTATTDTGATPWDAAVAFFHSLGDVSDLVGIVLIIVIGLVALIAMRYATKMYGDKLRMEIEAKKQEDSSVPVSLFEKLLTELSQTLTANGSQYEDMRLQMGKLESQMGTLSEEIRRSAESDRDNARVISNVSEKLTDMTAVLRDLIAQKDSNPTHAQAAGRIPLADTAAA